jgi:hypothetical protein
LTLFGGFRIDPVTGMQVKHGTTLARWRNRELAAFPRNDPPLTADDIREDAR